MAPTRARELDASGDLSKATTFLQHALPKLRASSGSGLSTMQRMQVLLDAWVDDGVDWVRKDFRDRLPQWEQMLANRVHVDPRSKQTLRDNLACDDIWKIVTRAAPEERCGLLDCIAAMCTDEGRAMVLSSNGARFEDVSEHAGRAADAAVSTDNGMAGEQSIQPCVCRRKKCMHRSHAT